MAAETFCFVDEAFLLSNRLVFFVYPSLVGEAGDLLSLSSRFVFGSSGRAEPVC